MGGAETRSREHGSGAHPRRVREGQRYFPREGVRREPLVVRQVDTESARARTPGGKVRTLAIDRLLATRPNGEGAYYRFLGWQDRPRGYRTPLLVLDVLADERCVVSLPEWDPGRPIELPAALFPESMRRAGARGSCRANLGSQSVAGLSIHSAGETPVRGGSREARSPHPAVLAVGQEYRRRSTGSGALRIVAVPPGAPVVAWNGRRRVRISAERLLECRGDGMGRFYEYVGGGVRETRRALRASQGKA